MLRVMEVKEDQGSFFLNASTPEKELACYLYVLNLWYGPDGVHTPYLEDVDPRPTPPELGLTAEQVEALPENSPLRLAAEEAWRDYARRLKYWESEAGLNADIRRAIENRDAKLAARCFRRGSSLSGLGKLTVYDVEEPE